MKVGDTKRRANKMRARNTNSKRLRSNVSHSKVKLLCLLKWPQTEVRKGKAKKEKKKKKKSGADQERTTKMESKISLTFPSSTSSRTVFILCH